MTLPTSDCLICGEFVAPLDESICPKCKARQRDIQRQRAENARCQICKQTIFDWQGWRFEPGAGYAHLGCLEPEQGGNA